MAVDGNFIDLGGAGGAATGVDASAFTYVGFSASGNSSLDGFSSFEFSAVPEPSSVALIAAGLAAFALTGRRRRR